MTHTQDAVDMLERNNEAAKDTIDQTDTECNVKPVLKQMLDNQTLIYKATVANGNGNGKKLGMTLTLPGGAALANLDVRDLGRIVGLLALVYLFLQSHGLLPSMLEKAPETPDTAIEAHE